MDFTTIATVAAVAGLVAFLPLAFVKTHNDRKRFNRAMAEYNAAFGDVATRNALNNL